MAEMKFRTNKRVYELTLEHDIVMLVVKEKQSNVELKITSVGNLTKTLSPENFLIWKLT
jgi:hypothetical protein